MIKSAIYVKHEICISEEKRFRRQKNRHLLSAKSFLINRKLLINNRLPTIYSITFFTNYMLSNKKKQW